MDVVCSFYSFRVLQLIKYFTYITSVVLPKLIFKCCRHLQTQPAKLLNLSHFALYFLPFILTPIGIPYG